MLTGNGSTLDYTGTAGVLTFENFTPNGFNVLIINYVSTRPPNLRSRLIFHEDQAANLAHFDFGLGPGVFVSEANLGNGFYEVYPRVAPRPRPLPHPRP
jgi:hypothetical protein